MLCGGRKLKSLRNVVFSKVRKKEKEREEEKKALKKEWKY